MPLRNRRSTMSDLEQNIRERAYQLWMENGCEHGKADMHWLDAQREVLAAALGGVARVSNGAAGKLKTKASAPRKKRRAA
ncbi:hypothetical protein BSZ22_11150 [Bradyrhizobium canariense]|uniref:DUF2934 domain-containing protein n=2 Tax=Bradyrhizobium canariense TaxID=255045 RepID=A0A1X3H696_9BRAD|nr:hypothetical protein BST65_38605 [Bradyrhizobium canariense]OSI32361.1 hypothetical protein BST66_17195 [Bradyrhizobium canariense]OSI42816.1 hypothetical protein BST67_39650 [Bradyrhizobium canariense]OSI51094.1 hypothetical protein BSZ20_05010 [Bradyrhizobium canariense]OSI59811.1 hypothetical protein BSZ15_02790 [Bradyrhizobium canariense]